uniref:Uncharacterized protein n=1 Tax=Glossina palpalis gambiensis TaxID=67801 RepID=A0A1B0BXR9_9MUSC
MEENSIYSLTPDTNGKNALFRFDPRDDKWCVLNVKPGLYGQCELVSYDQTLFAIEKNDCKWLDIRANTWKPIPDILSNRIDCSVVIGAKDIYVLGSEKLNSHFITRVERLNIHDKALESMFNSK